MFNSYSFLSASILVLILIIFTFIPLFNFGSNRVINTYQNNRDSKLALILQDSDFYQGLIVQIFCCIPMLIELILDMFKPWSISSPAERTIDRNKIVARTINCANFFLCPIIIYCLGKFRSDKYNGQMVQIIYIFNIVQFILLKTTTYMYAFNRKLVGIHSSSDKLRITIDKRCIICLILFISTKIFFYFSEFTSDEIAKDLLGIVSFLLFVFGAVIEVWELTLIFLSFF
jgi:hypothetical protein